MRVTDQQSYQLLLSNFQQVSRNLLTAQQQVSTGRRVNTPSDDPEAFGRIVSTKSSLSQATQWLRNIDRGTSRLDMADSTLSQVSNLLSRVKELAVASASGTSTANDRLAAATEVRDIDRQLVALANTQADGQSIFAGTKTDIQPYAVTSGDTVTYSGNAETQSIAVGQNDTIQVTIPGSQIFGGPTTDVFGSIANLLTALGANDVTGIQTGIADMDQAISQVANAQGEVGALENRLSTTKTALTDASTTLQAALSKDQDIDMATAIAQLSQYQTSYQASARALNTLFSTSLLNFLGTPTTS